MRTQLPAKNSLSDLQIVGTAGTKRPHAESSLVEADPSMLTKKALKKRRKLVRPQPFESSYEVVALQISKAAEMSWRPEPGTQRPKKSKSSGWSDAPAEPIQPVDYDAYDPNAFRGVLATRMFGSWISI